MKLKRVIFLTLAFIMVGAASVVADDAYDNYKAKQIKISINHSEASLPGLMMGSSKTVLDSKIMLPLNEISGTMQALVKWNADTQTVQIYKPNVHIFLFSDKTKKPFGSVYKGKYDFIIFTQIDNLLTDVDSLKITLHDPYGDEVKLKDKNGDELKISEEISGQQDNFWYVSPQLSADFKYVGKYTLNFYLRSKGSPDYTLISQKVMNAISE